MAQKRPGCLASCFWGIFITPIVLLAGNVLISFLPISLSKQIEQGVNDHIFIFLLLAYVLSVYVFRLLEINPFQEKDWL